ncbi:unnamed protein product [Gongylonema pulchrum]|uniref:Uncharacterized protein n=1 Tax=Gongylonema pulchrum TaxID=637853 RepID=A0A3P6SGZ9_9BILA|nr:unnamed protein product [Gongylonema pulchrum]
MLLTTSHYNYRTLDAEETGKAELILWKIKPVGPLCKCGGIRELARITSNSSDSFTAVTWLPAILPSTSLGLLFTSPSSCFVANCSGHLNIYQAVVDAADFLAEMHNSRTPNAVPSTESRSSSSSTAEEKIYLGSCSRPCLKGSYKVVSAQSSSKPGCILLLSRIVDAALGTNSVLLLHVFSERLLVSAEESQDIASSGIAVSDRTGYYLVLFEKNKEHFTRLRMWLISLAAVDYEGFGIICLDFCKILPTAAVVVDFPPISSAHFSLYSTFPSLFSCTSFFPIYGRGIFQNNVA